MPSTLQISNASLSTHAVEGLRHLESADWSNSVAPTAEFLGLLALRIVLTGYLIGSVSRETDPAGVTRITVTLPDEKPQGERLAAARVIMAPVEAYANLADIGANLQAPDTGALPIPVLVVAGTVQVALIAAGAYTIVSIAREAGTVVDNALKRKAAAAEIQRADAEALKIVNNHVQRELAAGKTIALDEASKSVLSDLQTRVGKLVDLGYQSAKETVSSPWVLPAVGVAAVAVVAAVYFTRKGRSK